MKNAPKKNNTQTHSPLKADIIAELAKKLAINHYNVSVAQNDNPGRTIQPGKNEIFKDGNLIDADFVFSRNVLIVGAGASKSAYDVINVADSVIEKVYEKLSFIGILKSNDDKNKNLWKRYVHFANNFSKKFYNEDEATIDVEIKKIIGDLSFEDNLSLLRLFIKDEELVSAIYDTIGYSLSSYPSLFYEIVAHLFKHRYIDIVINLNFDELLDNAIQDAMDDSVYYKVIDDSTSIPFSKIVHEDRLRIPIYIKPHGTTLSRSSLRFTNEHYGNMPAQMKQLLNSIFSGSLKFYAKSVTNFNIILAGYSFNDYDIRDILYNQIYNQHDKFNISYYIFDIRAENVKEKIIYNYANWVNRNVTYKESEIIKVFHDTNVKLHPITCDKGQKDKSEFSGENKHTLAGEFYYMYENIRDQFNPPFTPQALTRINLIVDLFPREKIINKLDPQYNRGATTNQVQKNVSSEYYLKRSVAIAIYEIIKFRGRVPINIFTSGRIAKYYLKYVEVEEAIKIGTSFSSNREVHFIDAVNKVLENNNAGNIKLKGLFWQYSGETEPLVWDENQINVLLEAMFASSFNSLEDDIRRKYISLLKEKIKITKYFFINPKYDNPKLAIFGNYHASQIINTNLDLTWKLYDFAVNKGTWDEMWFIDETGKSLLNLFTYFTGSFAKLCQKKIKLIYSSPYSADNTEKSTRQQILDNLTNKAGEFESINLHYQFCSVALAIFLENGAPKRAIYFFRHAGKININPIWFDIDRKQLSDKMESNLSILKRMFEDYWDLATWLKGKNFDSSKFHFF